MAHYHALAIIATIMLPILVIASAGQKDHTAIRGKGAQHYTGGHAPDSALKRTYSYHTPNDSLKFTSRKPERQTNSTSINEFRAAVMILVVFIISILIILSYKLILFGRTN